MVVLMAVLLAVGAGISFLVNNHLQKKWSGWAHARGWEFIPKWQGIIEVFRGHPFGRGSSRRASLGFRGNFDGLPAGGFRYQYTVKSGKNSTTYTFTILFVRVPGARFPRLDFQPENWATRTFGRDIQFEDAEFNRLWHVKSDTARFAHDVIHPRMMEFLKREMPSGSFWFQGDYLVCAIKNVVQPEGIDPYLRFMSQIVGRLPRFVLDEVGAQAVVVNRSGPSPVVSQQSLARPLGR